VIGIDVSAAAMAESSLRATRRARLGRAGGLANALFLVAAAERLPVELTEIAAEVTVAFPWGSLLRASLGRREAAEASAGIARLVAPAGRVTALVSIDPRDGLEIPPLDAGAAKDVARRWRRHGLELMCWRPATPDEIDATWSTWARRLRAGSDRSVWRLELRRRAVGDIRGDR